MLKLKEKEKKAAEEECNDSSHDDEGKLIDGDSNKEPSHELLTVNDKSSHELPTDNDKSSHELPNDNDQSSHELPTDSNESSHELPTDNDKSSNELTNNDKSSHDLQIGKDSKYRLNKKAVYVLDTHYTLKTLGTKKLYLVYLYLSNCYYGDDVTYTLCSSTDNYSVTTSGDFTR